MKNFKREAKFSYLSDLRQKAEEALKERQSQLNSVHSESDFLRLVHELEVHQIELEMQNDELQLAKEQAELTTAKYVELYEFAPSGYFILSREGEIIQVNIAGYQILGKEPSLLKNHPFAFFISNESKPVFKLFLSRVFTSNTRETCDLSLLTPNSLPVQVQLYGFAEPNKDECFVTMVDITERKRNENKINLTNEELAFQDNEKTKRAAELIIANKELLFQNDEKTRRAEELIIANIELLFQNDEKAKRAAELILANKELLLSNDEKAKLAVKLVLANKELLFQNDEKTFHEDELILANIELLFQNQESEKRAAELFVVNELISTQRDRLMEIASLVPGVVYQFRMRPDGSFCFPYTSEAIRQIYRVSPEEVREDASKVFLNLHPDDLHGVMISIRESAKKLSLWQHEYRVRFEDGTIRSLYGNAMPQAEADGSVLWHGFITDITDKKEIAHKLEERLKELKIFYALSQLAGEKDIELDTSYQRLVDLLPEGFQYSEITCARIVVDGVEYLTDNFEDSEWKLSAPILVNESGIGLIEIAYLEQRQQADEGPFLKEERKLIDTLALQLKQVIKRKEAEIRLRESESKFSKIFNSSPDMIVLAKVAERKVVEVNDTFLQKTGISRSDIIGKTFGEVQVLTTGDNHIQIAEALKTNDKITALQLTINGKNGSVMECVFSREIIQLGDLQYFLTVITDITQLKHVELALKNSEIKYRLLFENMVEGFSLHEIITDENGHPIDFRFLDANKAYEHHTGIKPEDCIGKTILSILPQSSTRMIERYGRVALTGEPFSFEYYSNTFKRHIHVSAFCPRPGQFATLFEDITELKEAEEKLKQNEAKYSSMIANISDVISIMDADSIMKYLSSNIEKQFGWLPEDLVGFNAFSIIHTDDLAHAHKELQLFLESDEKTMTTEFRLRCKDGSYKSVEIMSCNLLNDPIINGILVNFRDITTRKSIEEKLQSKSSLLEAQLNATVEGILMVDNQNIRLLINQRFIDLLNIPPHILAVNDDSKLLNYVVGLTKHPQTFLEKVNYLNSHPDEKSYDEVEFKSGIVLERYSAPIRDKEGKNDGRIWTFRDITSHKQSEQQIKLKNEELHKLNSERDKFFSIIAHDLRGPLGGFMRLTEMMTDKDQDFTDNERKEMIIELSRSARNSFNLLENLLEWSQMDRGISEFKQQKLVIADMVTDCLNILAEPARGKEIVLIVDIPDKHEVFADKNMLQTVIRNLLSNAIKFNPKGGSVFISAKPADNQMMVISVRDTGIGMSDQMRNDLFRIDANTRRSGTNGEKSTGLGLLLCREFVGKLGGEMWVESVQFKGTAFSFSIPSGTHKGIEIVNPIAEFKEKSATKITSLKILIAEDDEISAKLIHALVKSFSREILLTKTGNNAVEICRNNSDIDLIMMDIAMPVMDGYEATQQIRQFNKEVIIIAQTTFSMTADREKAFAVGCNGFISKPFLKDDLVKLIGKHIKR